MHAFLFFHGFAQHLLGRQLLLFDLVDFHAAFDRLPELRAARAAAAAPERILLKRLTLTGRRGQSSDTYLPRAFFEFVSGFYFEFEDFSMKFIEFGK